MAYTNQNGCLFPNRTIRHMFKLDPNKPISDSQLEQLIHSGTDGFVVGGSDGVSEQKVEALYRRIQHTSLPLCYEMTQADAFVFGFDFYFIPIVLNTTNLDWIGQRHVQALQIYDSRLTWLPYETLPDLILNPNCKAAELTCAKTDLTIGEVLAYTQLSTEIFHIPLLYIEYSGVYGDLTLVKQIAIRHPNVHIFYGGGIVSREQAEEMGRYVQTVVVGNVIYQDFERALQTVGI